MTTPTPPPSKPVVIAPGRPAAGTPGPVKMTPRAWYLVAGGLFMVAVAIAGTGVSQFMSTVEGMHRVAMPGREMIILPAGRSTLYVEHRSVVGGEARAVAEAMSFRCGLKDPSGAPLELQAPVSKVTYSLGGYAGRNAFDVQVPMAGEYVLECQAQGEGRFAMAIGQGVGTWIVVGLVGGLVPGMLAVLVFLIVLLKRRKQARAMRAAAAAATTT